MIRTISDSDLTNFGTWFMDNEYRLYRYWVFKKNYTPYEQEQKFSDEGYFEDEYATFGYIKEAIELPDGDILIGFQPPESQYKGIFLEYYKLSEIRLAYCEDEKDERDEDGEDE